MLRLMVLHVPIEDVTAVKNDKYPLNPDSLDGCNRAVLAPSPAVTIHQIIIPSAVAGTSMALARKRFLRSFGWIKQNGNWMSQKRKKQSISLDVTPADGGRELGKLANEGDRAMSI